MIKDKVIRIVCILIVIIITGIGCLRLLAGTSSSLIALLPVPEKGVPYMLVHTHHSGMFPARLAGAVLGNPTLSPEGDNPVRAFVPIVSQARESVFMVIAAGSHLSVLSVFVPEKSVVGALQSGQFPKEWKERFPLGRVTQTEYSSVWALNAENLISELYVRVQKNAVCLADSVEGALSMLEVHNRKNPGISRKWSVEPQWETHLLISEGGIFDSNSEFSEGSSSNPLIFEVAMKEQKHSLALSGDKPLQIQGEARWHIEGLKERVGGAILRALKPIDWKSSDIFIPYPGLFSMGVHIPKLLQKRDTWPSFLKLLGDQGENIGLSEKEVRDLLPGLFVLNIGGRTRVLWMTLPGMTLEMNGRGEVGYKLVDSFWGNLFMGAVPVPVDGFTHGGMTDLPFSVFAAAHKDKVLMGLMELDSESDRQTVRLLKEYHKGIGWIYLDLPRLSDATHELTQVSSLLTDEEFSESEDRERREEARRVRDSLLGLPKMLVIWENPESGYAVWLK